MTQRWNFSIPHVEGTAPRQAHVGLPAKTYERELGRDGFFGAASHIYHRNPPTAWVEVDGPEQPRAFNLANNAAPAPSPYDAMAIGGNPNAYLRYWRVETSMDHLVRNADGDELLFFHRGRAELYCDFGHLTLSIGDYVIMPRGVMWRLEVAEPCEILLIEATGDTYSLPERGPIGHHAPFDLGVLAKPALDDAYRSQSQDINEVRVKRLNRITKVRFPFNPLDAVGWKGDLYPIRLNVRDIRAITSHQLHMPPSIRATFQTSRFVVCTITPRPVETDPEAMKLPFFHSNIDYDELIFYHSGQFSSRGGAVGAGAFTYHPCGLVHGPHPATLPHLFDHPAKFFEAYSVMVDFLDPLTFELPAKAEVEDYALSWRGALKFAPDARPEALEAKV